MEKVVLEIGEDARLRIDAIGGDLRISGRDGTNLEAQAPDHGELTVEEKEGDFYLSCRSGCLVFLPKSTRIQAENVGGDARLTDIHAEILIRKVGGDLVLRRVGQASFELVGGDMLAKGAKGDLSVDVLGGDAVIHDVEASVNMRSAGGDLIIDGVRAGISCSVGGDISATISPEADSPVELSAGGDLACRLLEGASATLKVQAGGELHLPVGLGLNELNEIVIEDGDQLIELTAGGDLSVRVGRHVVDAPEDFVGDILTEVDAKLAEMEARFSALGAGLDSFNADRIGERVRRAVRRAQRKTEQAERNAIKASTKFGKINKPRSFIAGGDFGSADRSSEVSDDERLAILKMVEEGKISVEEAENLLQALQGEL